MLQHKNSNDTHSKKTGHKIIIIDWKPEMLSNEKTKWNTNNKNISCIWQHRFIHISCISVNKHSSNCRFYTVLYIKRCFCCCCHYLLLRIAADNRATSQMWTPFNQFGSVGFLLLLLFWNRLTTKQSIHTITCSMNISLFFFLYTLDWAVIHVFFSLSFGRQKRFVRKKEKEEAGNFF